MVGVGQVTVISNSLLKNLMGCNTDMLCTCSMLCVFKEKDLLVA